MAPSVLIRKQALDDAHSVTVWRQTGQYNGQSVLTYRKVWVGPLKTAAQGWLSWGLHENFLLTLLAGRGVTRAVTTMDIHKDAHRIELLTLDAGPELQRDWIDAYPNAWSDQDWVKLGYHTLQALAQIHREGVVHGDLKADNICVPAMSHTGAVSPGIDWQGLKLIDFAFSLSRDYPLRFVLPTDTQKINYLPEFYKRAIVRSQQLQQPHWVQKACCGEIDLFSLGVMLQQLVLPSASAYPGTMALAQACLRAGGKKPWWRWPEKGFADETVRLERAALNWLHEQGLQGDAIRCSMLPRPESRQAVTPLRSPVLPKAMPTPLLVALYASSPTPRLVLRPSNMGETEVTALSSAHSKPAPAASPESMGPLDPSFEGGRRTAMPGITVWARLRWLGIYLMVFFGFAAIDQAYRFTQLPLSDVGYALALLGMACAVPMGVGVLLQVWRPSPLGERNCSGLAMVLLIVGFFHGQSAWLMGLSDWQQTQLVAPWLLAMGMWIKWPRVGTR